MAENPFASGGYQAPNGMYAQPQHPSQVQNYGYAQQNPPQHPPAQQYQPQQYSAPQQNMMQAHDPFAPGSPPPPQQGYSDALVPSTQMTNPYAGMVAPPPPQGAQNMQIQSHPNAPAVQQGSYYGFGDPNASSQAFGDPNASSQALVPVPPNAGGDFYYGAPPHQQYQQPPPQPAYGHTDSQMVPQPPPTSRPPPVVTDFSASRPVHEVAIVPFDSSGYPGAPPAPRADETMTPSGMEARNKYSDTLAQEAPIGASPLPRADMVRQTGYVLSRISFRTIVMKKWKQSFWVQYGPHTMLWFRSQSDFDDWLNNPYHTQAQRNFLIKLAVNFAHDLYKPNVRGYQVTQCRTKSYGAKLIRQFKLERWMDYGPTIAAAFGSNNPKEVDELREALVACMRNTPLNGGIRATGAVRERADHGSGSVDGRGSMSPGAGYDSASYAGHANMSRPDSRSVASAGELGMDQKAFEAETNSAGAVPARANEAPDLLW